MKLIQSPLQFKKFNLLNYEFKFNLGSTGKKENTKGEVFPKYLVDVNFAWKKNIDEHVVFCKIEINRGVVKEIGYSIFAEGIGVFNLANGVSEADKKNLITYSAPSIVLQELRSLIRSNTFIAPMGAYVLPTINIQAQINEKMENLRLRKLIEKKNPTKRGLR